MSTAASFYARLPVWMQNAAVSGFGAYWYVLRFGPGFSAMRDDYRTRDRFTVADWQAWQRLTLAELLAIAATQVPHYRETWSARERQAAAAGRLDELPLLSKEPLRQAPERFLRQDRPRPRLAFSTSGSSGTPIVSLWTARELRRTMAVREARSAQWAGVSFGQPRATISGRMVVPDLDAPGPFHRFNRVERQVYLSAYHLRPEHAAQYVDALRRHRVTWLTGYAVGYFQLAQFILDQRLTPPPLRAIITTSEKVTSAMRVVMEDAFRCRVWEEYSTVENALFASECEAGSLHVSPDIGIVEILREDGSPCEPGEQGEVVATVTMPRRQMLVRFRVGDLAAWAEEPCRCGRALPVLQNVFGRTSQFIRTPSGGRVAIGGFINGVVYGGVRVAQSVVVQEALDHVKVVVVPGPGFGPSDERDIIERMRARLGGGMRVSIETTNIIPPGPSGKAPSFISRLSSS